MLRTINSRPKGSGIVEFLSEAGARAEGTIKDAMQGSNVKQGVRYYKLLFVALFRTKLADTRKTKEQQRQMKAQNTSKGTFFTVEGPAEESLLPTATSKGVDVAGHLAVQSILSFQWIRL